MTCYVQTNSAIFDDVLGLRIGLIKESSLTILRINLYSEMTFSKIKPLVSMARCFQISTTTTQITVEGSVLKKEVFEISRTSVDKQKYSDKKYIKTIKLISDLNFVRSQNIY